MSGDSPENPMFSIIMPVYNHAAYVEQAVQSILDQTFPSWELVIVDDGSTDDSGRIVEELARKDSRISVIHQANAGPAAARNAALPKLRAEWLTYLDSDDVWFPYTLANYALYIQAHPQTQFIHGYRNRLNEAGVIEESKGEFQDRPTGMRELFSRMYLSHLSVCYRRSLLDLAGPYDSSLRACEDYDLYLRISRHCRFDPLGLPTGLRRRHDTNLSRQSGLSRIREALILERFLQMPGVKETLDPLAINQRLGQLYYAASRQYFKERCYRQSIQAAGISQQYRRTLKGLLIRMVSCCLLPLGRNNAKPLPTLQSLQNPSCGT